MPSPCRFRLGGSVTRRGRGGVPFQLQSVLAGTVDPLVR